MSSTVIIPVKSKRVYNSPEVLSFQLGLLLGAASYPLFVEVFSSLSSLLCCFGHVWSKSETAQSARSKALTRGLIIARQPGETQGAVLPPSVCHLNWGWFLISYCTDRPGGNKRVKPRKPLIIICRRIVIWVKMLSNLGERECEDKELKHME